MNHTLPFRRGWFAAALAIAACAPDAGQLVAPRLAPTGPSRGLGHASPVVISQVYGAGGNSGAVRTHDYVELFNPSGNAVTLNGYSLQYASATGTGSFSGGVAALPASVTIPAGGYYLVQMSGGANGSPLPTPDATGTLTMAATAGKIALVDQTAGLACNGGSTPCTPAQLAHIVDLVGYGSTANFFEGSGPTPAPSTANAVFRANDGCTDTNNNASDFAAGPAAPRNSASPTRACGAQPTPVVTTVTVSPSTPSVVVGGTQQLTASAFDQNAQPMAGVTFTWSTSAPSIATVDAAGLVTAVAEGSATITATAPNGVAGTAAVTVTPQGGGGNATNVIITEIHYDNAGTDANEAIEIAGDANGTLDGWSLVLYSGSTGSANPGPYATLPLSGAIPATCGARGVVVVPGPATGIQNGDKDGVALVNAQGQVVQFLSYEGSFVATGGPANGLTSTDIGVAEDANTQATQSLQRAGNGVWFGPATSTFGACNPATPPAPSGSITVQPRSAPLPVGFQTQLFLANGGVDSQGNPVGNQDVTWSTSDAAVVSVNAVTGVVTAQAAGSAVITATAKSDGVTTGSTTITTTVATVAPNARVGHNTELGAPADANPADDVHISRRQFALSYNAQRGVPNWVAWNLDASHVGSTPRCNCFTRDPQLVALGLPAYETSDWINDGTNGQWSRGHMSPSADWNVSDGDNAATYYLTNMLPQNQAMNGGPWGAFENYLRGRLTGSNQIYVVSGGIFTPGRGPGGTAGFGTISNRGQIAIPDSTWKVAVIVPDTRTAAQITAPAQIEVIAINTPNEAPSGVATWNTYVTTVDKIQKSTGYDLLALLAEAVECKVEVRNCLATATLTPPTNATAGVAATFHVAWEDADGSTDAPWKVTINWGDGTSVTGTYFTAYPTSRPLARQKTWSAPGTYTVTVTIVDKRGATSVTTQPVVVK